MKFEEITESERKICESTLKDIKEKAMQSINLNAMTNMELVSIVLHNGKKTTHPVYEAQKMTADNGLYKGIAKCNNLYELTDKYNLTKEQALTLLAGIELGKRISSTFALELEHLASPQSVADYLMPTMRNMTHENFYIMAMNTKNRLIKTIKISEGSLTCSVVHPREVFAQAIIYHAASIIAVHNHPSGDPRPSSEDETLTSVLNESGKFLGIPLLDHIIIGDCRYYSFKEHGKIDS